jgi:hypothetical protein
MISETTSSDSMTSSTQHSHSFPGELIKWQSNHMINNANNDSSNSLDNDVS